MGQAGKLLAWMLAVCACAVVVPVILWVVLASGLPGADAAVLGRVLESRAAPLLLTAALLLLGCAGAARWLFGRYAKAARALAEQTRVISGSNPDLRLSLQGARELAEVAAAINGLADTYGSLRRDSESRAADARLQLEEERNRLAALMSELGQGVLVCNAEGAILLYNEQVRALFAPPKVGSAHALVGLGRSLFALLDRDQVAHAVQRLERSIARGERLPSARFIAPISGGRVIKAQVAPYVDAARRLSGLVFALEDVTGLLNREAQRRSLLQTFGARIRAPVATIRAAAENLAAYPEIEAQRRTQFIDMVATESAALSSTINEALREYADALKTALTLEDMRASDVLELVRKRVEALGSSVALGESAGDLWVRVDSYSLVQAMAHLATRLREEHRVRAIELCARAAGRFAEIDLRWRGMGVPGEALPVWEAQPMQSGTEHSPLTVRDVLDQHGGEIWHQVGGTADDPGGYFRFLVPIGEPVLVVAQARPKPVAGSRPEYYDFDLFARGSVAGTLGETPLTALSYTAFDTETTGLEPSAGDEIISIGAVRVVNGRLLRNEIFEQLVDPRRPIHADSARVHGIDAAALAGQPTIAEVLPAFHRFCEDTILVAHNAAFDMRFLELKELSTGVRFAQPVLDTLLLSAVTHPSFEDHQLEMIAERVGIQVMGRHTALGDALLTGEIFLKLLPLLMERGIVTLGQALEASRKTYYARLQY